MRIIRTITNTCKFLVIIGCVLLIFLFIFMMSSILLALFTMFMEGILKYVITYGVSLIIAIAFASWTYDKLKHSM